MILLTTMMVQVISMKSMAMEREAMAILIRSMALKVGKDLRTQHSFQPGSTPWRGNRKYLCKSQLFMVSHY